jgi:hypothetical protein
LLSPLGEKSQESMYCTKPIQKSWKEFKSDNYMGSYKEKSNIAIAILKK